MRKTFQLGEPTELPKARLLMGREDCCPSSQEPHPRSRPFGPHWSATVRAWNFSISISPWPCSLYINIPQIVCVFSTVVVMWAVCRYKPSFWGMTARTHVVDVVNKLSAHVYNRHSKRTNFKTKIFLKVGILEWPLPGLHPKVVGRERLGSSEGIRLPTPQFPRAYAICPSLKAWLRRWSCAVRTLQRSPAFALFVVHACGDRSKLNIWLSAY